MNRWQDQFPKDASLLPHLVDINAGQILLSRLNEEDYRKASFLDQRIITPQLHRKLVPWAEVSGINLPPAPAPQYIFHIGHVGSTLISRLLGEIQNILALREPQLLRNLSEISLLQGKSHSPWSPELYQQRLTESIAWLSRSFHPEQRVMIKTSSFVSELAGSLLAGKTEALFLYTTLERYLPTILAGEASTKEIQVMAASRLQRLSSHLSEAPANLWELSLGKIIAMSWLCELVTLFLAQKKCCESSIIWLDFEKFLIEPEVQLQRVVGHFGHSLPDEQSRTLISGSIMSSYSKAPEHDYSPDLRAELLKKASRNHAEEIKAAMAWVDQLAAKYAVVAEALQWIDTRD